MKLKYNILSLSLLIITSIVLLSCDDEEPVYYSGADLDIRFAPFAPYAKIFADEKGYLIACARTTDGKSYICKVHDDGRVDSTYYAFVENDLGFGSMGDFVVNNAGQLFIYDHDFDNNYTILRFEPGDFTHYKKFTMSIPRNYGRIGGTPLDDGGFIVLAQEEVGEWQSNWCLFRMNPDGSLCNPISADYGDASSFSTFYSVGDKMIIQFSTMTYETIYVFSTLDGKVINKYSDPGKLFSSYLNVVNNSVYVLDPTYDQYSTTFVFHRFDIDGSNHQYTPSVVLDNYSNVTEINNRMYVTGYSTISKQGYNERSLTKGYVYSINLDDFNDIDSISMGYNVVPHAVLTTPDNGYNVFLSRRFDYDDEMARNASNTNIYIYHVDDLHKLQIDAQQ